jgi:putative ABC transport system permease protein
MRFFIALRIALRALAKNKLRASLTLLGIVIGIAAVTTMVSLGESANKLILQQVQSFGTNLVFITPASDQAPGGQEATVSLKAEDAEAIARECPHVLAASPVIIASGQYLVYGSAPWSPKEVAGVGTDYLVVRNWTLRWGEFFTEQQLQSRDKVCVIGQTVVANLFQTRNPLGQIIRINRIPFFVIGVLAPRPTDLTGNDQNDVVLLPHTTVQKRLQGSAFSHVHGIMASARGASQMDDAAKEVRQLLTERHRIPPGEPADFKVQTTTQIAESDLKITRIFSIMLAAIAALSLVVGGVGVMNIMLVSVTERTREIGVRLALGARSRDVLRQFLTESVLLSSLGGVVGIALGAGATFVATAVINSLIGGKWPMVISLSTAGTAMAVSAAVGVCSGFYPALRASRLDPIEALRYE